MKFKLIDPIGKQIESVFVHGEMRDFNLDQWEKSDHGTKIRELRKANNIGLREAAKVIGISATELSKVETGKLAFEDESDFDYICNIIFTWMGPYGQHSSHWEGTCGSGHGPYLPPAASASTSVTDGDMWMGLRRIVLSRKDMPKIVVNKYYSGWVTLEYPNGDRVNYEYSYDHGWEEIERDM